MKPVRCRKCGWQKFDAKHPCVNPDCVRPNPLQFAKVRHAISATTPHGFHAPVVAKRYAV